MLSVPDPAELAFYTKYIYFLFRPGTFLFIPELPNLFQIQQGRRASKDEIIRYKSLKLGFPVETGCSSHPFKGTLFVCLFFPWRICYVNLEKKQNYPQILRLKHKLAALQRSAEELFVCC